MKLQILHESAFDGPSLWLDRPVVRAIVAGDSVWGQDPPLEERIEQLGRTLDRTQFDPLPLPPAPAESNAVWRLGWATIGLQRLAGDDVSFFLARGMESSGERELVVECRHRQTGFLALRIALQQLNAGGRGDPQQMALERAFTQRLAPVAASRRPIPEFELILAAARARAIPITSIDPRGLIHELGHGVYRRRVRNVRTSNTSYLGEMLSSDKQLSLHYLAECGLPVPETLAARDVETAIAAARKIGFPVAIKPNDEGNSVGLHLDVRDEAEVRTAFDDASRVSRSGTAVVQRYLAGRHYRILVVGERIIGVTERLAAHVVGDGRHSVRQLVDIENRNPRRGTRKADWFKTIAIDEVTTRLLEKQGWTLDDVPPRGVWVPLQRIDDIEGGGEAIAFTGPVHPDNVAIIRSAVRALEVDIAGVDLIAEDIERSIWETSGGILEVNCSPGYSLIQFPTSGDAIDPGPAVIESLFPPEAPVRVPLVAVTGNRATAATCQLTGRILAAAGYSTGMALDGGLYLGETRLGGMDGHGVDGKRRILLNPAVAMAVLEVPPDEIAAQGLAFQRCDVAVITGLSGASPGGLPPAESVVCRSVTPDGAIVTPGNDSAAMAFSRSTGRQLVLYGAEPEAGDRQPGDWAVWLRPTGYLVIEWADGSAVRLELPGELARMGAPLAAAIGAVLAIGVPLAALQLLLQDGGIAYRMR